MYIVKRGSLSVVANDGKKVFATLGAGSVFGEVCVLSCYRSTCYSVELKDFGGSKFLLDNNIFIGLLKPCMKVFVVLSA